MAGEVLNRLHYTCKITHGDLHTGNILIESTKPVLCSNIGNILLIDWGRAKMFLMVLKGHKKYRFQLMKHILNYMQV